MAELTQDTRSTEPNFVAFRVSGQDFCVDILSVREICSWTHVTPLPKSTPYIRGVINLRGSVVPILDFPVRFGLTPSEPATGHVIIVVKVGERILGMLVDEVTEILNIGPGAIKPIPDAEGETATALVSGVISHGKGMIRLVDLAQITSSTDAEAA